MGLVSEVFGDDLPHNSRHPVRGKPVGHRREPAPPVLDRPALGRRRQDPQALETEPAHDFRLPFPGRALGPPLSHQPEDRLPRLGQVRRHRRPFARARGVKEKIGREIQKQKQEDQGENAQLHLGLELVPAGPHTAFDPFRLPPPGSVEADDPGQVEPDDAVAVEAADHGGHRQVRPEGNHPVAAHLR